MLYLNAKQNANFTYALDDLNRAYHHERPNLLISAGEQFALALGGLNKHEIEEVMGEKESEIKELVGFIKETGVQFTADVLSANIRLGITNRIRDYFGQMIDNTHEIVDVVEEKVVKQIVESFKDTELKLKG